MGVLHQKLCAGAHEAHGCQPRSSEPRPRAHGRPAGCSQKRYAPHGCGLCGGTTAALAAVVTEGEDVEEAAATTVTVIAVTPASGERAALRTGGAPKTRSTAQLSPPRGQSGLSAQATVRTKSAIVAPAEVVAAKDVPAGGPLRRFASSGVMAVGRPRTPAGATTRVGVMADAAVGAADGIHGVLTEDCEAAVARQGGAVAAPLRPSLVQATTSVSGGGHPRRTALSGRHP